jgi:hypothetical protein
MIMASKRLSLEDSGYGRRAEYSPEGFRMGTSGNYKNRRTSD